MKRIIYCLAVIFTCFSCTEKELDPISKSNGKPGAVRIIENGVTPTPGGAIITYQIPNNEDILMVRAIYTLSNGQKREETTSFYEDHLEVVGYNDTNEHEILLYTVNRAQEYSDAISVKITPLESPLSKTAKTVNIISDFGGANFSWKNEDMVSLSFELQTENLNGDMQTIRIVSSNLDSTGYTVRGFDPLPRKFAVIIADNYGNETTIYPPEGTITPLFEQKLDKKDMEILILDNDVSWTNWEGVTSFIIDDDVNTFGHTYNNDVPGASFVIDLHKKAKLSRFIFYQRGDGNRFFRSGNAENFEVYVCFSEPSKSGNWNEWTKVANYKIIKPSGAPIPTLTDEDMIVAQAGHDFSFPLSLDAARYIRFRILSTWEPVNFYAFANEITTYGVYVE
jgi:hypothetical protein